MNRRKKILIYSLFMLVLLSTISIAGIKKDIGVPINTILMYSGVASDFDVWGVMINDTDWHICNGNNGTPLLLGRFVVGYDDEDEDYETIGQLGGEKTHVLTLSEMPYHEHTYIDVYHRINRRALANGLINNAEDVTSGLQTTSGVGGNVAHENRPPYYVVIYIIRVS